MTTTVRNYGYKNVDMLMTAKTVVESFKANLTELTTVRTDWTAAYATELSARIDAAIDGYLGTDSKRQLREATTQLTAIQQPAQRDLSFFKTQVEDDFKKEKSTSNEILNTLGFTKNLRGVQRGKQDSLAQLLYTFKLNMTPALRTTITSRGLNPILIDTIIGYANIFAEANVNQESLKGFSMEVTQEMQNVFNGIYDEIIGICKKASVYYQYDHIKKDMFTFSKVLKRMGAARKVVESSSSKA